MIGEFRGPYAFLSNFQYAQQRAEYDFGPILGKIIVEYATNENFFAANKTLNWQHHMEIALAPTPAIAKRMGGPKGYVKPDGTLFKIQIRDDWKDIGTRIGTMKLGIDFKFNQNPHLQLNLIQTYPKELCEGNRRHDNFWGDCRCARCLHIPGQNFLGRLLMAYRLTIIQ